MINTQKQNCDKCGKESNTLITTYKRKYDGSLVQYCPECYRKSQEGQK